jgi:hypothetical protein
LYRGLGCSHAATSEEKDYCDPAGEIFEISPPQPDHTSKLSFS